MSPQKTPTLMDKLVLTSMIIFLLVSSPVASLAATAQTSQKISSHGMVNSPEALTWLHTDGKHIKNEFGEIVRLTGVGLDGAFIAQDLAAWGRSVHLDLMIQEGVKIVRIFVCYGWWTGEYVDYDFPIGRDVYRATIDDLVARFNDAGIYCFINFEGSYEKQQEWSNDSSNWADTLAEIALRYEDYPGMCGIEPQNEPTGWCWEDRYYIRLKEVAQAIHAANPDLLVIAETGIHGWKKFPKDEFPIDEPNTVYAYHMYYQHMSESLKDLYRTGQYAEAKAQLEAYLNDELYWMLDLGYPVMDTEFGVMTNDDFPAWDVFLQDYFDLMKKYDVQWTYFAWENKPNDYGCWNSDWSAPSPHGEIVFANIEPLLTP